MRIPIASDNDPMILALKLKASKPKTPIRIRVADADMPNTSYTDREAELTGTKTFYMHMPRTGKLIIADAFRLGTSPRDKDSELTLVSKEIYPVQLIPQIIDNKSELAKCGFEFIQKFSQNAGWLSAGEGGSVYKSDCGRFRVDYMDVIRDTAETVPLSRLRKLGQGEVDRPVKNPNYGKQLSTPMRISTDRGIIQASALYIRPKPVSERVGIGTHELGHFYLNSDQHSEEEADYNAVKMVLGNGYGFIDTRNAFLNVFQNAQTDQNQVRDQKIYDLIDSIEKKYNKYY